MPSFSFLIFPFFHLHPIFWVVSLLLYFLPALLARNKPNFTGVLMLNIFLGWTFIGWIVALVWAISNQPQGQTGVPPQTGATSPAQPAAGSTLYCSACGKPCTAGARFCSSCGAVQPSTRR